MSPAQLPQTFKDIPQEVQDDQYNFDPSRLRLLATLTWCGITRDSQTDSGSFCWTLGSTRPGPTVNGRTSPCSHYHVLASATKDKTQPLLALSCLYQSFRCGSPFQLRDLFHLSSLPSASAPVCHQLAFPLSQKDLGVFHGGHAEGCNGHCVSFTSSILDFFVCTFRENPAHSLSSLTTAVLN